MTQFYFGKVANSYNQKLNYWPLSMLRSREAQTVIGELFSIRDKRVLDLGCGAGFYARRLLREGAGHVTAVDNCSEMIKALPIHELLDGIVCNAEDLPTSIEPFDAIVSAGLLEFVSSPERVLAEARRVSTQRCKLVLLVPTKTFFGRLYRRWHFSHSVEVRLFDISSIRSISDATGWRILKSHFIWPFSLVLGLEPR